MHLYVVSTIQNLFPHKDIIVHKIQAIKSIWFNISLDSNISICQKSWCWNFFPITEIKLCTIYIFRFANPHQTFLVISYALAIVLLPTKNMYACMYWNRNSNFKILNYSRRSYDQGLRIKILYLTLATASSLVLTSCIFFFNTLIAFLFIIFFYIIFLKF